MKSIATIITHPIGAIVVIGTVALVALGYSKVTFTDSTGKTRTYER